MAFTIYSGSDPTDLTGNKKLEEADIFFDVVLSACNPPSSPVPPSYTVEATFLISLSLSSL